MSIGESERQKHLDEISERGYTILENAIDLARVDALAAALLTIERERKILPSNNAFEGERTVRIYNLLVYEEPFVEVPLHESVLPIVEGVLDPNCLVSTLSSISIGQDETEQLIHSDDQVIGLPRPGPALVCNTMWALTDFTAENGATRLIPGSHLWDHYPDYSKQYETIAAEMSKGSVLIWNGSLFHGGGANQTSQRRVGLAMNYCAGFIRQQENQQLGIPNAVARRFPKRLQRMLGYGVYRGLIGHIEKADPIGLLGDSPELRTIWDR